MSPPTSSKLLSALEHPSGLTLKNRVVLAPLTRGRSGASRVPNDLNLAYYKARASAGLLITEGASFSQEAHGWAGSAAIETQEQVEGWKRIVDAVHAEGSLISVQLWHTGRAAHSSYKADNSLPVAPSAIAIQAEAHLADGSKVPYEVPRPLETSELPRVVADYKAAAERAKEAGFDFIEIHSANGYLLDTFLQSVSNERIDSYGGSKENRFRLIGEVLDAVTQVYPANRVGIRLSPNGVFNSMGGADNADDFTYYITRLNEYGLGWLHILDGLAFGFHEKGRPFMLLEARAVYKHPILANCGYTQETAEAAIASGNADAVAFGRPFLNNPDLVERFRSGTKLNESLPMSLWYSPGAKGYTEVPVTEEEAAE
ncbi:12-oxophytodienoate reductase [Tribonema minus]|uniref:12-oxophytodienoate reductase n=1 Tax=Tribonema minus TaxID=303371 RepID=A0A835YIH1_9STRA|nr:12-oxophytodienoate reductase [Tribonema minus]